MSNTDFLGRAIDTVKKAIDNDNEGEYEKAYQLYYSSLELFMLALKWEKNPRSKEMIRAKTAEYMERAEKLKNHLASSDNRKKPSALGTNGSVAQGSGKGEYVCQILVPTLPYLFLSHFFRRRHTLWRRWASANGCRWNVARKTTAKTRTRRNFDQRSKELFYRTSRMSNGRMLRV